MFRSGKLAGKLKTNRLTDMGFSRNGCFEVVVCDQLAEKALAAFPKCQFAAANIVTTSGLSTEYVELTRPVATSIDLQKSGYQLKWRCPVCGFNEMEREPDTRLVLTHVPDLDCWTTLQNPFLCCVSDQFGEFLLQNSNSAFWLSPIMQ
jgi:hypothetical protein